MTGNSANAWKCAVCGYIHEGPNPPELCPVCGAPADQFIPVEEKIEAPEPQESDANLSWHRVAAPDELSQGEVKKVIAANRAFALVNHQGKVMALDHACPHQAALSVRAPWTTETCGVHGMAGALIRKPEKR